MKRVKQRPCLNCGKEVSRKPKKFCDNRCQREYQYKQFIERWKCGEEDGLRGYQTSNHIRRYLFDKYDSSCCKCGWSEKHPTDGTVPLEVEHKDGDYTNNMEENLELLCPNCHSLTTTFKNRNKGNGREARRKNTLK